MRNEKASTDDLAKAIELQHGGTATFAHEMPVTETWQGKTVWKGTVHVFDLAGHPTARRAYAWSEPVEGSDNPTAGFEWCGG